MKFRDAILCAAFLCLAVAASATPKSDDGDVARGVNGNGNGLGHAYGHLKAKVDDVAQTAASVTWIPTLGDHSGRLAVARMGDDDDQGEDNDDQGGGGFPRIGSGPGPDHGPRWPNGGPPNGEGGGFGGIGSGSGPGTTGVVS